MNTTTTLLIDVRTNRIVFFTCAEPSTIPTDSRNLVATVPSADLPEKMSLENCYAYRFVSGKISSPSATPSAKKPPSLEQTNRNALAKALRTKLQTLWDKIPAWQTTDSAKRCEQFNTLDVAFADRIAVATTEPEFTGLAKEIELLSV